MKFKETLMAVAIAVVAALFIGLLVDTAYPAPEYEDFCGNDHRAKPMPLYEREQTHCNDPYQVYEEEVDACHNQKGMPEFEFDEDGCQTYVGCNMCAKEFNEVNKKYNRDVFLIITPISVIAIILGLVYAVEVIGGGFMVAGILLLIYATARYFSDMSKIIRLIVVFFELVLLIIIAKKKMGKK